MTEKIFEYIIIGPPDVGKTSIMLRYIDNMFCNMSYNTIGIDMRTKRLNHFKYDNTRINIYDTAGQERYFSLTTSFIRNKDCIFLCFSLANSNSLIECEKYIDYIYNKKKDNACIFLVGTFLDMKDKCNNININDIINLCTQHNYKYIEVSSKTGEGIRELFELSLNIMNERNLGHINSKNFIFQKADKCC
jgi:small GTP-binding protein